MAVQQPLDVLHLNGSLTSSPPGSFKAHKPLPHPHAHPQKRIVNAFIDEDRTHVSPKSLKRMNGASMPGSFPNGTLESTLPPTPPRHSTDHVRSFSSPVGALQTNGANSAQQRIVSYGRSVKARSPPTPDQTPPATAALELPIRPTLQTFSPSSRADSFRTAREEQWPSDDEGGGGSQFKEGLSGAVKPLKQSSRDKGLGLDFERDDDSTPTPKKLKQAAVRNGVGSAQLDGHIPASMDSIPDREWDTNMMRNVTVRRKKRPILTPAAIQEDEERVAAREIVPKLFTGSSEDDESSEPLTPSNDHLAQTMPSAQRSEERPKRHSGSSHTSTILEAIIVPSSPPRRRTLRHVSKNLSLRSDDGSSRPSSNHASIASDEMSFSQLNDSLRSEHMRRVNGIYTPDLSVPVPAVPLKHHPESRSLRANSGSSAASNRRRASDGTQSSSPFSQRQRSISNGYAFGPLSDTSAHGGRLSFVAGEEPIHVKYDAAAKRQSNQADSTSQQMTRAATRKALQRLDSSAGTIDARPGSMSKEVARSPRGSTEIVQAADQEMTPRPAAVSIVEVTETTTIVKSKKNDNPNDLPPLETTSIHESAPRVSFDQSTVTTHGMHRASDASSNLHADSEHANARHLFAQSTPFSQVSEHEIGEANAVNIYPHNNNSLLVVQQVARPSVIQKQHEDSPSVPGWPTLTVQPATPPQQFSSVNVDSPLKNPREPPMPPIINIHPATPASELEDSPLAEAQVVSDSQAAIRPLSLVQKAWRYSDNMMRPIITRTSSLRRSYYRHSRAPRDGAPRHSMREPKAETTGLHPFWQPRGFWDEYSDSDSDSDWGEPEPGSSKRLPAGGDTTELGEPRGFAKVLDKTGLSRGFLIGNSLGLERAGTNKKRPVVQVPVGLGQRTSGRVVLKRNSQGTLHTVGSDSLRSARIAKRSVESLREMSKGKPRKAWNPKNWQVQYVGVGGMRDLWRHKQAEKRRQELKGKIGVRYSIENAPTNN